MRELAREAMEELRSVIVHLRPPALEAEGLAVALGKHVDVLRRAHRRDIALSIDGRRARAAAIEGDVFRIAQEALHNALRHAGAEHIAVRLRCDGRGGLELDRQPTTARASIRGAGARARRLGLTTMAERARAVGRHARGRVGARRGHDRHAGGARVIRVLVVDDHAVVRQGLRTFLELQDDIEVVGEADDGERGARAGRRAASPTSSSWTSSCRRLDGVRRSSACARRAPATRVIVLTSFLDEDKVLPAVRAGAAGYLLKDVEPAELVRAIRMADRGEALLHPAVAARVLREVAARRRAAPSATSC